MVGFRSSTLVFTALLLVLSYGNAPAQTVGEGAPFPALSGEDQFGEAHGLTANTRYVIVSFSMGVGKKANRFFSAKGSDWLPGNRAVFAASINGMPSFARVFAMPKMRKYAHRILLLDDEELLDRLPQRDGFVTVFELDDGNVRAIRFWDPDREPAGPFPVGNP